MFKIKANNSKGFFELVGGVSSTLRSHEARPDAAEFKTTGGYARQYAPQEN